MYTKLAQLESTHRVQTSTKEYLLDHTGKLFRNIQITLNIENCQHYNTDIDINIILLNRYMIKIPAVTRLDD